MKEEFIILRGDQEKDDQGEINEPVDDFIHSYSSMLTDYVYKTAIATILVFMTYPWMAFFWPPYYYLRRQKE